VEGRLVDAHVQEPLEQQVVVELPQNARSERIEYSAINTVDFNNVSGGTLRRPPAAYIATKVSSVPASTASTRPGSGGSDDPAGSGPQSATGTTSAAADRGAHA